MKHFAIISEYLRRILAIINVIMYTIETQYGYKYKVARCIFSLIKNDAAPPVIMCVGCDVPGDNLGPIAGDMLIYRYNVQTYVYGCMNKPLTAGNVYKTYNFIKRNHNSKILVIDAAMGGKGGIINIYKGGIKPAAAVFKDICRIGDYSLTCNIKTYFNATASTPSQRLNGIKLIAANIACAVNDAVILHKAYLKNFLTEYKTV